MYATDELSQADYDNLPPEHWDIHRIYATADTWAVKMVEGNYDKVVFCDGTSLTRESFIDDVLVTDDGKKCVSVMLMADNAQDKQEAESELNRMYLECAKSSIVNKISFDCVKPEMVG